MPTSRCFTVNIAQRNEFARAAMQALIPVLFGIKNPRDIPPQYAGDKAAWLADEAFTIADAMAKRAKEIN